MEDRWNTGETKYIVNDKEMTEEEYKNYQVKGKKQKEKEVTNDRGENTISSKN